MTAGEARALLEASADEGCRQTFMKCVPGAGRVIGVRSPVMHDIAKRVARSDWREFLCDPSPVVYEEDMLLRGAVIGALKESFEVMEPLLREFVPKMTNWAVCDSTCSRLKMTRKNMPQMLGLIRDFLRSDREYELRFALVMLMSYYIDDEHIDYILDVYDSVQREEYYIRMAVAWGLSVCFVKQRDKTLAYLQGPNALDKWTFNKAIQKCVESFRVSAEDKALLRSMKCR